VVIAGSQAGALVVIHKSDQARNVVITAGIAGQIGRTADLHGFAARRVRDKDVPNASRSHGGQLLAEQVFDSGNFKPTVSPPCGLDSGNPCRNDGTSTLVYNGERLSLETSTTFSAISQVVRRIDKAHTQIKISY